MLGASQRVTPLGLLWSELTVRPGPTLHMLNALRGCVERRGLLPNLGGVDRVPIGDWRPILLTDPNPPARTEPPLTQEYNPLTDPSRIRPQPKPGRKAH